MIGIVFLDISDRSKTIISENHMPSLNFSSIFQTVWVQEERQNQKSADPRNS